MCRPMTDDKNKTDNRDRSRVAGGEDHEVRDFGERNQRGGSPNAN
jgi:hypothetical protein